MSDEAGLLAAIRASPADDFPRRVYADWLDDRGEPERAELIRLQLDLAAGDETGREREQALLADHGQRWLDEVLPGFTLRTSEAWLGRGEGGGGRFAAFRRGLVSVLFMPAEDFTRRGKELAAGLVTVARVQLTNRSPAPPPHPWSNHWIWRRGSSGEDTLPSAICSRLLLPWWDYGRRGFASEFSPGLPAVSRACVLFLYDRGVGEVNRADTFSRAEVARICRVEPDIVEEWIDANRLAASLRPGGWGPTIYRDSLIAFMVRNRIPFDRRWADGDLEGVTLAGFF